MIIRLILTFQQVTRFAESHITADVVYLPLSLINMDAENVIIVKHFSWGNIVTFQRTGLTQAGLYIGALAWASGPVGVSVGQCMG